MKMQINPTSTYIIYAACPFAKEMKQTTEFAFISKTSRRPRSKKLISLIVGIEEDDGSGR